MSDVPVLLLTGAFDPVTPPEYAHLTASTLSQGTVVEFADQGHVVATSGACASEITHRFLTAPLAPVDAACAAEGSLEYVLP